MIIGSSGGQLAQHVDFPVGEMLYFADGLLQHQIETTPARTTVDEHSYGYTPDGDKSSDTETVMARHWAA